MTKTSMGYGFMVLMVGILLLFLYGIVQVEITKKQESIIPITNLTFNGGTITASNVTEQEVVIPSSYSIVYNTPNEIGEVTFLNRNQAFTFLQQHYAIGSKDYYDFYNQIYSFNYPYTYQYSISKPTYIEGDDLSITSIDNRAFSGNRHIEKILLPDSIINIGSFVFQNCENLKEVDFGENLQTIGDSAFWGCGFESLIIPNSVKTIRPYAFFSNSKLKEVIIGTGLVDITLGTFNDCERLEKVTILSENNIDIWTTSAYQIFSRCENLAEIYVPINRLEYFKSAEHWSLYADKYVAISR